MTTGLACDPLYPIAGELVTLAITDALGQTNAARFELLTVPPLSELVAGMLVDNAGVYIQTFTPDVAGEYAFAVYDVRVYLGLSQHSNDANGGAREQVLSATARGDVHVASPIDLRIETIPGHNVTLRMGLVNETIRSAEFVDPSTDLARLAAIDTAVVAALETIVDVSVTALVTTLTNRVALLRIAYEAHRVLTSGSVHASSDTTNLVQSEPPTSDEAALDCLREIYTKLGKHMRAGATGGTWHTADDTKNLPITPLPFTKWQAHVVASDLEERVYERHRLQTASPIAHGGADGTNTLPTPSTLTDAIVAYLDFIAANTSAVIAGENERLVLMERKIGAMPTPV